MKYVIRELLFMNIWRGEVMQLKNRKEVEFSWENVEITGIEAVNYLNNSHVQTSLKDNDVCVKWKKCDLYLSHIPFFVK